MTETSHVLIPSRLCNNACIVQTFRRLQTNPINKRDLRSSLSRSRAPIHVLSASGETVEHDPN